MAAVGDCAACRPPGCRAGASNSEAPCRISRAATIIQLNGDVQRWFEPVLPATLANPVMQAISIIWTPVVTTAGRHSASQAWHVELHQFRIETSPAETGRPTPEGLHRDGVDWVFVMLVDRHNVSDGVTEHRQCRWSADRTTHPDHAGRRRSSRRSPDPARRHADPADRSGGTCMAGRAGGHLGAPNPHRKQIERHRALR